MIRFTLAFCLALLMWVNSFASQNTAVTRGLHSISFIQEGSQKKAKPEKKASAKQQKPDKPKIKEVPKARKQSKPMVVKPNVKVKPIKIIKPKIKRP